MVDARPAVIAVEVSGRAQLDEVVVALGGLGEQRQVRPALARRSGSVIGHDVRLKADDRRDPALSGLFEEFDRAAHHAVIGQRDCRLADLFDPVEQPPDLAGAIQNRVVGMDVKVGERPVGTHLRRRPIADDGMGMRLASAPDASKRPTTPDAVHRQPCWRY